MARNCHQSIPSLYSACNFHKEMLYNIIHQKTQHHLLTLLTVYTGHLLKWNGPKHQVLCRARPPATCVLLSQGSFLGYIWEWKWSFTYILYGSTCWLLIRHFNKEEYTCPAWFDFCWKHLKGNTWNVHAKSVCRT